MLLTDDDVFDCVQGALTQYPFEAHRGCNFTMAAFDRGRPGIFTFLAAIGAIILFTNITLLTGADIRTKIEQIPVYIPGVKSSADQPAEPEVESLRPQGKTRMLI